MAILNPEENYNPKLGLKNIFTKLVEIIKAINANTSAIAALPVQPKTYKALLTQSGTDAPVATVLVNTLSGTPVWSYGGAGYYQLTLTEEFTDFKTFVLIQNMGLLSTNTLSKKQYAAYRNSNDEVVVLTADETGNALTGGTNDLLSQTSILIEVYE